VHAGQGGTDPSGFHLRHGQLRPLRRARRRLRRGPGAREHPGRRLLPARRASALPARPADPTDVPPGRSHPGHGGGRLGRAATDRLRAGGSGNGVPPGPPEERRMATTAALLILALLVPAAPAAARGAETDPARRNMVVEAVEKASPAVVNISTEEVVEQRGSPF